MEEILTRRFTPDPRYGDNVRAEVKRARRTQTSVAMAIGMSWPEWTRRTGGQVSWRIDELTAVAAELRIPLQRLTNGGDH